MQREIGFLRRRHASLFRAVENLEHNFHMINDLQGVPVAELEEIQDRMKAAISEAKATRIAISDKISELEGAS